MRIVNSLESFDRRKVKFKKAKSNEWAARILVINIVWLVNLGYLIMIHELLDLKLKETPEVDVKNKKS